MADERVEKAFAAFKKSGKDNKGPVAWIKALDPLQELVEISLNGGQAEVLEILLKETGSLPITVRPLVQAFRDLQRASVGQERVLISGDYEDQLPSRLVAGHDPVNYRRAVGTIASVLNRQSPAEIHALSHAILAERNRTGKHQELDLSSALGHVVMAFDLANEQMHYQPIRNFGPVTHK